MAGRSQQIDSEEDESKRIAVLRDCHCCKRCILRFLGRRTIHIYASPSESCPSLWKLQGDEPSLVDLEKASGDATGTAQDGNNHPEVLEDAAATKQETAKAKEDAASEERDANDDRQSDGGGREIICPACLGILQELCEQAFIEEMCSEVTDLGYDFNNFMLALTLPLQLEIRQHCLLTYLNEMCRSSLKSSDITPLKDVFKWLCGPMISQQLRVPFHPKSPFEVGLIIEHKDTKAEVDLLMEEISNEEPSRKRQRYSKNQANKGKGEATRQIVGAALRGLSAEHLKRLLPHPPSVPESLPSHNIDCLHQSVFLAGRYTKHSRNLSQTPWILDGERKTESSVQELVCDPIQECVRAADYRFSSSGREDVDVRTLGRGRPFLTEMLNPRKIVLSRDELKQLQEEINEKTSDIGVLDLQLVGRDATQKLKEGEAEKRKSYMALVKVERSVQQQDLDFLEDMKELVLKQKTPIRVLHRRPLATRERTIHSMSSEIIDEHHFKLFLCTQAGTYIKEFVHGDLGRTQPNVGTLLKTDADIMELDVTAVHVDWPKKIDD
ncbi:tRNA pseudouridine synthase Pus10-like [Diadema antillarum]|uniref:tRNA pseudouridine synthase Pus10-like n=1 Tax=Diadema antillarum TaxID=105358 RepID=UPI003A83F33D